MNRIYQGSVNKFTKKSWDDNCLNKGPTLTVVQADNGRIFGGYTSQNWSKKDEKNYDFYTTDDKAWLFSFDRSTKHKVRKPEEAICNNSNWLCKFGGSGRDLVIQSDGQDGFFNCIDISFELPPWMRRGSDEARAYLAGSIRFKIKEIEVFSVTLK